jgi:hypothetical protein
VPALEVVLLFQLKGHNIGDEPTDAPERSIRGSENCGSNVNGLFCELFPTRAQNGGQKKKYLYNNAEKLPDGVC